MLIYVPSTPPPSSVTTRESEPSLPTRNPSSPCLTEPYEYWFSQDRLDAEKQDGPTTTSQSSMQDSPTTRPTQQDKPAGGTATTTNKSFSLMISRGKLQLKNFFNFSEDTDTAEDGRSKEDSATSTTSRLSSSQATLSQQNGTGEEETCHNPKWMHSKDD